jgi:hypothetical protein
MTTRATWACALGLLLAVGCSADRPSAPDDPVPDLHGARSGSLETLTIDPPQAQCLANGSPCALAAQCCSNTCSDDHCELPGQEGTMTCPSGSSACSTSTDCPAATSACKTNGCYSGCCMQMNAPSGTACAGGTCNGQGQCCNATTMTCS